MPKSKANRPKNRNSARGTRRRTVREARRIPALSASGAEPRAGSKLATLVTMLRKPDGATIAAMSKATGWQTHSVRGALAGAIGKKFGLKIVSEKTDGTRTYRIAN